MDEDLLYLRAPPDIDVAPPVRTHRQVLPFAELSWENFERLCLRLAEHEGDVENTSLYGTRGQGQQGIDIFARRGGGEYTVYQCRCVKSFTATQVKKVVDDFLTGTWAKRARTLTLCTSAKLSRTKLAEAVEAQNIRLREHGKAFVALDSDQLSRKLKTLPALVLDFFDRGWVEEFCPDVPSELAPRLGASDLHDLRRKLAALYKSVFELQDTAVLLGLTTDEDRPFVLQDVVERRELPADMQPAGKGESQVREHRENAGENAGQRSIEQRLPLTRWLASAPEHVLVADAGSGKSSILRHVATDLLCGEPQLGELMSRWSAYLPVWLPFGFWVKRISAGQPSSLAETLHAWLADYSEERLWPLVERGLADGRLLLLIDGLDEWSDPDAAMDAFKRLAVFVKQRGVPILATSRLAALKELGPLPASWRAASLAGLTRDQQLQLVTSLDSGNAMPFLAAVERSPDLRVLARTPLLLVLLLRLYCDDAELPQNRFKAYAEVVSYMLFRHPRRGERTSVGPLEECELLGVLAAVAYTMQSRGDSMIETQDAERAVAAHLARGHMAAGRLDPAVNAKARAAVADARSRLGILVDAAPGSVAFLHRSFQEHLASVHLAGLPAADVDSLLSGRAMDAGWHEVLLNLLALTSDPGRADELILAIFNDQRPAVRWSLQPLFADILACGFGTAAVTDPLSREVLASIETAPSSIVREQTLARLISVPAATARHAQHVETWLPGSDTHVRAALIEAMGNWPQEEQTAVAIWRGLFDEETACSRAAARAYVTHLRDADTARERLVALLDRPIEAQTRAAALEALAGSRPDHEQLPRLMQAAETSVDPNLRLVAYDWRISRGEQTRGQLEDLLAMAGRLSDVDYDRKPDVVRLVKTGWPRDETVKKLALQTLGMRRTSSELDNDVALWLVLAGYPGDQDVIDYCLAQIERAKYPFLALHIEAWRLLAHSFRDEPSLIVALDAWMPKQKFHEPEISYAALLGRTATGKATMIAGLAHAGNPHWYAQSLLEGWGMQDTDVGAALTEAARGNADLAGRMAHSLPNILTDPDELHRRLRELVGDPANPRPGLALETLGELGQVDELVVDSALSREDMAASPDGELWHALIEYAPGDPRVREPAERYLDSDWYSAAAVAHAYADDNDMRAALRARSTPLPAQLRTRVAEQLRDGAGPPELTITVCDKFLRESDPLAAATQAQARVRCQMPGGESEMIERISKGLQMLGPTYERTRQAALAAALELGRADLFVDAREPHRPDEPVEIGLTDFLHPNAVLADIVVKHWTSLEELIENVPARLSRRSSIGATWDSLSLVAEQNPSVTEQALRYVDAGGGVTSNLLRLYAAVRPGDERLKELCIHVLRGQRAEQIPSGNIHGTAAEIIGLQFAGDTVVLGEILAAELPLVSLLLVLAEGWPGSPELEAAHQQVRREERQGPTDAVVRVSMGADTSERALLSLRELVRQLAASSHFVERPLAAIARRLRRDGELAARLEATAAGDGSTSEIASFARLLTYAGALSPTGRDTLAALAEQAFRGELALQVGYDIVAGRRRPLAHALAEAIEGN